jgi:hypothetical protein
LVEKTVPVKTCRQTYYFRQGEGKHQAKPSQAKPSQAQAFPWGMSARDLLAKTQKGYPATRTEGKLPKAEISKTRAKINSNNGQERKTWAKRGSCLLR